jgi:hypothetical protein
MAAAVCRSEHRSRFICVGVFYLAIVGFVAELLTPKPRQSSGTAPCAASQKRDALAMAALTLEQVEARRPLSDRHGTFRSRRCLTFDLDAALLLTASVQMQFSAGAV